jgi:hypothetical protein
LVRGSLLWIACAAPLAQQLSHDRKLDLLRIKKLRRKLMKRLTMKYTRRRLQWRSRLIFVPATLVFFIFSAQAQTDAILPPIGGSGGSQFVARCPQGQFLTGFDLRTGDVVDAIRPLCVPAYGPADVGSPVPFGLKRSVQTLFGPVADAESPLVPGGISFGGNGGGARQLLCPKDAPIVTGMYVMAQGVEPDPAVVRQIHLFCGIAAATQQPSEFPSAVFDGQLSQYGRGSDGTQRCPAGLVSVGISGHSGQRLDEVGLICGPPKLTVKPPKLGRAREGGVPTGPPRPICDQAREARARNSPVATNLEAQCRAAQQRALLTAARTARETPPVKPGGAGPTIIADSNPVMVPNGQDSGATTITWKPGPDYTYCEIYLSVDDGEWSEFARSPLDTKTTTIKLGSSYTFRMMVYEGQAGTPKIITTLTVTAKH